MNKFRVSAIVAMDEKRGIGKNNTIPWKIPGEQKMFKEITMPHPMIMGRKTFESLGRILPGRPHIVTTRDATYKVDGVTVVNSLEEGLEVANKMESERLSLRGNESDVAIPASPAGRSLKDRHASLAMTNTDSEIFVIGGGQIFKEALEKGLIDRLYLTIVDGDYDATIFFPDYSEFTKKVVEENKEVESYKYKFLILEK